MVHGTDRAVGKGCSIEAGSSLGVLVVPQANCVLGHCLAFRFGEYLAPTLAYKGKVYCPVPELRGARTFGIARPLDHDGGPIGLCSLPEITNLCIERSPEGRPRGAASDIGGEALLACDAVGVLQNSQHGRHHQITRSEAVTIEVGFVAERLGERRQAFCTNSTAPGR